MVNDRPPFRFSSRAEITNAMASESGAAHELGDLPVWNLGDLYPAPDSAEFTGDLENARAQALAFEEKWKGKLSDVSVESSKGGIGQAIREFEALEDILGRIGAYAGLTYYGDMTDPAKGKFFSDIGDAITEIATHLLFFSLELNRIDDDVLQAMMA